MADQSLFVKEEVRNHWNALGKGLPFGHSHEVFILSEKKYLEAPQVIKRLLLIKNPFADPDSPVWAKVNLFGEEVFIYVVCGGTWNILDEVVENLGQRAHRRLEKWLSENCKIIEISGGRWHLPDPHP